MKKNFLSKLSVDYLPARIIKGKYRWYIQWYQTDPSDGKRKRHQRTYELNRIKNKKERLKRAQEIRNDINGKLPTGWPYKPIPPSECIETISDAIEFAHALKCGDSDRKRTKQMYGSVKNIFIRFLKEYHYDKIGVKEFTKGFAIQFMDHLIISRKVANRTYNNYLVRCKALFNTLEDREVIEKNPFAKIKKRKEEPKKRKRFTKEQRRIIANYIKETDAWLYRCILLEYYCYIRPNEQRFITFGDFNFNDGTIFIRGARSKNGKDRYVTIPDIVIREFLNPEFCKYPTNYYVFGAGGQPGTKSIGINTMRYRHNQVIKKLQSSGKIGNTEGLTLYSWKDTGISEALEDQNVLDIDVKSQADHWSMDQTLQYYHKPAINQSFKKLGVHIDK